jgi:Zn-dependent protease
VISRNFTNFKRDDMLVSLAGPASNLLLAVMAFFALAAVYFFESHLPHGADPSTAQQALGMIFNVGLQLNLVLCIFNLFPIPPLDGSHVLRQYLSYDAAQAYDRITGFASYILIILVARFLLGPLLNPVLGLAYRLLAHI